MKKHCRCLNIALYELKTGWRGFGVFFLICCLLLSTMISIFSLALQLPDELQEYITGTSLHMIHVGDIDKVDLSQIDNLPLKVVKYYYNGLPPCSIGIDDGYLPPKVDGFIVDLSGAAIRGVNGDRSWQVTKINQQLLNGRPFEERDSNKSGIWLSDLSAEYLGVESGDSISFCVDSPAVSSLDEEPIKYETVSCTVMGIYSMDASMNGYYVTFPLIKQSEGTISPFSGDFAPLSITDYKKVISELRGMHLKVSANTEIIDSMLLLVYALYGTCVFLCFLAVSMLLSISKMYYHRRMSFFAICKAIGLQNRHILIIICSTMQGLLTVAFAVSMFIAPLLNRYVIDCIEEVFKEVSITANVWTLISLLLYFITSSLLWIACSLNQAAFRSADIINLMRQKDT